MFANDPDKPNTPAIGRILSVLGMISLIASPVSMLLAFSRMAAVNQTYAIVGAIAAFVVGVIMIGQAETLKWLAVVSARVKSRFAIEHAMMPTAPAPQERKPAPVTPVKERVITIPEEVARQQGVTRRRELD